MLSVLVILFPEDCFCVLQRVLEILFGKLSKSGHWKGVFRSALPGAGWRQGNSGGGRSKCRVTLSTQSGWSQQVKSTDSGARNLV